MVCAIGMSYRSSAKADVEAPSNIDCNVLTCHSCADNVVRRHLANNGNSAVGDLSCFKNGLNMDGATFKKTKLAHMCLSLFGISREEDDCQVF